MKHNHTDRTVRSSCPACRSKKQSNPSYSPANDAAFTAAVAASVSYDSGSSSISDCSGGGSF